MKAILNETVIIFLHNIPIFPALYIFPAQTDQFFLNLHWQIQLRPTCKKMDIQYINEFQGLLVK